MKKNYDLMLKTWSHMNPNAKADNDVETIDVIGCDNYWDAVREAKKWSKNIGKKVWRNSDDELAEVSISCYLRHDYCEELWEEFYEDGKKLNRFIV